MFLMMECMTGGGSNWFLGQNFGSRFEMVFGRAKNISTAWGLFYIIEEEEE